MKFDLATIKQKVTVPASPEQVYEAFTNAKKHSEFTGSKATGKAKVGNEFTTWDGYSFGKYLELEPGKRIVQEWTTTDWPEGYPPSKLELALKKVPKGTEITMIQKNAPKSQAEDLKEGWIEFYWTPLKEYFKNK